MSEYIEIETEITDDPQSVRLLTNLSLSDEPQGVERYASSAEMEEGSPLAQTLAYVEGIRRLEIEGQTMTIVRDPIVPWHVIIADVSAALREFFL
jgi:hypothetical protein